MSIFGAAYVISTFNILRKFTYKSNRVISFIAQNTLPIYLLQGPIYKAFDAYIPEIHEYSVVFPIIVLVTSLIITMLFKTNKLTNSIITI